MSEVVPTGRDTYLVGATQRGGTGPDAEVTAIAVRRANEFCQGLGSRMEVNSVQSSGLVGVTPRNAQVMFSCVK